MYIGLYALQGRIQVYIGKGGGVHNGVCKKAESEKP